MIVILNIIKRPVCITEMVIVLRGVQINFLHNSDKFQSSKY
jgi:hypothetical protein